jgi:uncharacterized delta-60 repeat protein
MKKWPFLLNFHPQLPANNLTFSVGDDVSIVPITPTEVTNVIHSCTISPSLPSGMVIDNKTCVISGATTAPIDSESYTVTATNKAGSLNAAVTLTAYQFKGIRSGNFGDTDASSAFDINPDYTTATPATFKDTYYGMTLQPDGKLLVVGSTARAYDSGPLDGFIARLETDGSLDTSFNGNGKYIYDGTWGFRDFIFDAKVHDNKIYAFGASRSTTSAADSRGMILRLNMDGTLDTTWGSSGTASIYTTSNTAFILKGEVLSDGKLIVMGYAIVATVRSYFVAKFNADGTLDTTFATLGSYLYPSDFTTSESDLIIDSAGRILISVHAGLSTNYKTTVIRLTPSGAIDTTWGTSGVYTLTLGTLNYPRNFVLKDDVLLVGGQHKVGTDWFSYLLKLDSSGVPVNSWGASGVLDLSLNPAFAGMFVQNTAVYSNQIICSGNTTTNFQLFSLDFTTGALVSTFGTNGFFTGNTATPNMKLPGITIDSDNKIIWGAGTASSASANTLMHAVKLE